MPDILETLFGSRSRARVMRLFVLNPGQVFLAIDIRDKTQMDSADIRRDLTALTKAGMIKIRTRGGKKVYTMNDTFSYYVELRELFIKSNTYPQCAEVHTIKDIGRVKLIMLSGVFVNYVKAEVDLLIVGDDIDRDDLLETIDAIEAEIGREVRYMSLTLEDFHYRLEMMDRFLIELFSGPHDTIVNKVPGLNRFISEIKR